MFNYAAFSTQFSFAAFALLLHLIHKQFYRFVDHLKLTLKRTDKVVGLIYEHLHGDPNVVVSDVSLGHFFLLINFIDGFKNLEALQL